ncbi:sce7726 family protein [Clostridium sp. YIM B02551]|uniref:sce7726 family protein n=1 Tax=Clostridium sp. YIM B02551 TaxID=2910679 RepID=UPI001EEB51FB|nr:sce7726 family protein [Clostridium sp. YIM B02551]
MNYMYLNKYFSKKKLVDSIFDDSLDVNIFVDELHRNYKVLDKEYRNEYFFKNTLFNKYVLGKYSLNTTTALSEVVIGKSKADFILLNREKGMVYEIKTDLDNLERLSYQLDDYYRVFSEVYVVTSEKNYYPVYKFIKDYKPNVGIIVLSDKVTLSIRKQAEIDNNNLNYDNLFKLLRKKEYEEILQFKFKSLPDVKPVQYFKVCLSWFKQLDIKECQTLVFNQLRKRIESQNIGGILDIPMQIRWLVYSSNLTYKEFDKIHKKFNER